jgi:hypothetical protein
VSVAVYRQTACRLINSYSFVDCYFTKSYTDKYNKLILYKNVFLIYFEGTNNCKLINEVILILTNYNIPQVLGNPFSFFIFFSTQRSLELNLSHSNTTSALVVFSLLINNKLNYKYICFT